MTIKDAYLLLDEFCVPQNIVKHSEKVMQIAEDIAEKIIANGIEVDIESLKVACLLHDILKIVDLKNDNYKKICEKAPKKNKEKWDELRKIYSGVSHSDAAAKLLRIMGEEKLARLVEFHRFDAVIDKDPKDFTLEEKIMTYADKRVLHDKVVPLKKRFSDGLKRYNIKPEDINEEIYEKYFEIERELLELQKGI